MTYYYSFEKPYRLKFVLNLKLEAMSVWLAGMIQTQV